MYCGVCKKECDWEDVDFGYGVTEYWGSVSNDVDIQRVSVCCEGDLYEDPDLEVLYQYDP
jgi:hypothetical protein